MITIYLHESTTPFAVSNLDEQTIAAFVRGELGPAEHAAVEAALDDDPQWLAVVAVLARGLGGTGSDSDDGPRGGVPAAGTAVGRYVLGAPLGHGASGVVCDARDPQLQRDVALKLVDPSLLMDPARAQARLAHEAKALARAADRHVVRVFDVGTWQGRVFIAMERLDGGTLDAWRQAEPRSWRDVVARWIDAGAGLAAAHRHGLVHRDFKPTNVMLDAVGRVVVVDFGLAREPGTGAGRSESASSDTERGRWLTRTGAAVGTPAYMAPEQRDGGELSPAADQFAFCTSLHEALCGTLPDGTQRAELPPLLDTPPPRLLRWLARGRSVPIQARFEGMEVVLAGLRASLLPRRRARRWVAGVGLLSAAIGGAWWVGVGTDPCARRAANPLPAAADALEELERRSSSRAADRLAAHVDGWLVAWRDERTEACQAHSAGTLSDAAFDAVVLCLDQQGQAINHRLGAMAGSGAQALRDSAAATVRLLARDSCLAPASADESLGEQGLREAAALRKALEDLEAARIKGEYDGLPTRAEALVARADALGHARLRTRTRLVLGLTLENASDFERAEAAYEAGADVAMAAEIAEYATRNLTRAAWVAAQQRRDAVAARTYIEHAAAWSLRGDSDPALETERLRVLGHVEWTAGDHAAAATAFEAAYAAAVALPAEHPEATELVIATDSDWGGLLVTTNDLVGATPHFERAMAAQVARVGEDHPAVAEVRNNVAALLRATGELERALPLFEHNLEVFRTAFGPTHERVGATLVNLAVLELDLGRNESALAHAQEAVRVAASATGEESAPAAKALTVRADAELQTGHAEDALRTFTDARALLAAELGEDHAEVGVADAGLAEVLLANGRAGPALVAFTRALTTLSASPGWGPEDSRLATVYVSKSAAHTLLGDGVAAHAALDRALEVAEPADELVARVDKGALLLEANDAVAALVHLERALGLLETVHADTGLAIRVRLQLAEALRAAGRDPERARGLAEHARDAAVAGGETEAAAQARRFLQVRR